MKVMQTSSDSGFGNFSYLIRSEDDSVVISVDPWDAEALNEYLVKENITLSFIVNTHLHWDHTKGNDDLTKLTGAKIYTPKELVDRGEIFLGGREHIKILSTPGHTGDDICFLLCDDDKQIALISGDTLFNGGVGNCKNGGDVEALYESVQRELVGLDDDVKLYPGHNYLETNLAFSLAVEKENQAISDMQRRVEKREKIVTTLGEERQINCFLKAKTLQEFIDLRRKRDLW